MSYIASLLDTKFIVPCQSDDDIAPYAKSAHVGSNQCSWCAAVFTADDNLCKFALSSPEEFVKQYRACLIKGSKLRGEQGTLMYGENVDDERVLKLVRPVGRFRTVSNPDMEFLSILPQTLLTEFYTGDETKNLDGTIRGYLAQTRKGMLSRYGLSIAIQRAPKGWLVLDSHSREVGLMSEENLIRFIKMDAKPGESWYGTFVWCA